MYNLLFIIYHFCKMFHYFVGKIRHLGGETLLTNDMLGIQVHYLWNQNQGEFFLYPYLDDNKKTVFYYCFDTIEQKVLFESLLKINGVWPKTAFQISQLPQANIQQALKNVDVKFFQAIPWIGPKSAKKILLQLKGTFDVEDMQRMDIDQKLYKNIVTSLKWFGYSADTIKSTLQKYEGTVTKDNMSEVIKWIISQM
jgi:Holliday junction resolvasome RuvABC DNA-binding subunit